MGLIVSVVVAVLGYFKADPKKTARIIAEAIGWLTVALQAIELVIPQAIAFLRDILAGLGAN